jgi:hypothetical protein
MTIRKFIIALIAIVLAGGSAVAAERIKVDRKALASVVTKTPDKRNALVAKYEKGESLTPAEMAVVYYGQAYVPGHKPAASYPDVDAAYAKKDYPSTLTLVDAVLRENPVALNQLFRGYVAAANSTEPRVKARAENFQKRIVAICSLIFSSGSGVTGEEPFIVLTTEDAMAFVRNYLQPTEILGQAQVDGMDAVKVKWPDQTEPVIFYFARP